MLLVEVYLVQSSCCWSMHGNANIQLKDQINGNYKQDGINPGLYSLPKIHDLKINAYKRVKPALQIRNFCCNEGVSIRICLLSIPYIL